VIDLREAQINGAPDFWRGIDWRLETLPVPNPDERELAGIPFDKVHALLEYDARFGTLPAEQGWEPNSDAATQLYRLDDEGILQFRIATQPAFFTAQARLREEVPIQVHAYSNILLERIPNVLSEGIDGFEQRVEAKEARAAFRGMRADWVRISNGREFHYVTLNSSEILASPQPVDPMRGVWHQLSLQGDYQSERTLLHLDGQLDEIELGRFGRIPNRAIRPSLRAAFGFRRESGAVNGRLRNFVVSAPGRFIRAWLRLEAPVDAPILRLGFIPQERVSGGVRFRVRYGEVVEPVRIPSQIAEATLKLNEAEPTQETPLDIPLDGVQAGEPFLLTLERLSLHDDDTLELGVRLVSAMLFDPRSFN
jgi:hypothetical protein